MKSYKGYYYAIRNYFKTEKARYDIIDYGRACIVIGTVMVILLLLCEFLTD
jgi:hypothetical protein